MVPWVRILDTSRFQASVIRRHQISMKSCGGAGPTTRSCQLVLRGHNYRIDRMDNAVARGDFRPRDGGAADAELVTVLRDRCSLTLQHLRRGQFPDINNRCPTRKHVVLQYGDQLRFVLWLQPVFQCALREFFERRIRRRKHGVRARSFQNAGEPGGFDGLAKRMKGAVGGCCLDDVLAGNARSVGIMSGHEFALSSDPRGGF